MKQIQDRGQLLYTGIHGKKYYDNLKSAKRRLWSNLFLFLFSMFMAIISLLGHFWIFGSSMYAFVIWLFIVFILLLGLIGWGPEIDGIYENGITNHLTLLSEYLRGKSFHPFNNITKIGYGIRNDLGKTSSFIVIYENNSLHPTVRNFTEAEYKNDFYQVLVKTLREKCPNAVWEKVDWDKLPTWKKT